MRILPLSILFLTVVSSAHALNTPLMGGGNVVPDAAAPSYACVSGNVYDWKTPETDVRNVVPIAGTIKNLYFKLDTAPGTGKSYVFTVLKNGSDTTLTCAVSDLATSCNDTTHTFTVVAGDGLSIRSTPSGTPASPVNLRGALVFSTSSNTESLIIGNTRNSALSTTLTQYGFLAGNYAPNTPIGIRDAPIPTTGTIDSLYVDLNGSPGVGSGYTFVVTKGGVSTGITCTISALATTCNDTTHSASFALDELVAMQFSIASGTPTARLARWGVRWTGGTNGEVILLNNGGATTMNNAGLVRYVSLNGGSFSWNTAEAMASMILPGSYTLRKWRIQLTGDPTTGGTGYTLKSRKNTADGTLSVTINAGSTTGTDTTHSDSLVATDILDASSLSTGAPVAVSSKWGVVLSDPSSEGGAGGSLLLKGAGK